MCTRRTPASWIIGGAALASLSPLPLFAGAWLPPSGELYLDQRALFYQSDQLYDASGNTRPQNTYSKFESGTYAEMGLSDAWSAGATFMLDGISQRQSTATRSSNNAVLTDPELFAKYKLLHTNQLTLSLQPLIKLPSRSLRSNAPQSGSRSSDTELSLLAGYAFEHRGRWHYADARIGYRNRSGQLGNQLKLDATLGYRFADDWLATTSLYSTWSASGVHTSSFNESSNQDYDLVKLEGMLHYQLTDTQSLYGGTFYHASGHNSGAGLGFLIGTAYRFHP